ncbi:MAG: DUF3047 domain-containing protein [Spiribacter sp.]|jgi:hypothetical protein|nr:DUF3047 domain-containing protein [Spiribacter sp.]MDR9489633.1 DUF3047 domain-containing protein [Spiribacter sp.]
MIKSGSCALGSITVVLLMGLLALSSANTQAQSRLYTPADILAWPVRSFAEPVDYSLAEVKKTTAVVANCTPGAASAHYLETDIDLTQTPILTWRWFVPAINPTDAGEQEKTGDDFPVRIYAVFDAGLFPWQTQAINYVWARETNIGHAWPNPFTAQAMMLAVETGEAHTGQWREFERDLRDDFAKLHGSTPERIDGIAIMSDCDNTGIATQGAFGRIQLRQRDDD